MYRNKKIIAVIPARQGSKGIKNKNIIKLNGFPLIAYSISAAKNSKYIDKVFVSTDGKKIKEISEKYGAEIIDRPKSISGDYAASDSVVLHAVKFVQDFLKYHFDIVVFIQATSPLRNYNDIDEAIKKFIKNKKIDSLFASVDYLPFLWKKHHKKLKPINFNKNKRQRRQDVSIVNETGSFYIAKKNTWLKHKNRFGKKTLNFNCNFLSMLEIDNFNDYNLVCDILKSNLKKKYSIGSPKI